MIIRKELANMLTDVIKTAGDSNPTHKKVHVRDNGRIIEVTDSKRLLQIIDQGPDSSLADGYYDIVKIGKDYLLMPSADSQYLGKFPDTERVIPRESKVSLDLGLLTQVRLHKTVPTSGAHSAAEIIALFASYQNTWRPLEKPSYIDIDFLYDMMRNLAKVCDGYRLHLTAHNYPVMITANNSDYKFIYVVSPMAY